MYLIKKDAHSSFVKMLRGKDLNTDLAEKRNTVFGSILKILAYKKDCVCTSNIQERENQIEVY